MHTPASTAETPHAPTPKAERRVLVVEDSPEDREIIRRYLAQDPLISYVLVEAATGEEAIQACKDGPALDCLLLDYDLPDMDGLEFLATLEAGAGVAPFAVVMLTGRGGEIVAVQALKLGVHDYLVKGHFTAEGLRHTIDEAIHKVATARELERQRLELERLYAEARDTDRRKDEFLAMLAHELRNPMAPILNAVQIMGLRGEDPKIREQMRALIERQVRHLVRLVDDLLDVSRIARGAITLQSEPVTLTALMDQAVESVRPSVEAMRHTLSVRLPAEPVRLQGDPTRLGQVLVNLLANAVKYTDPGGSIEVEAQRAGAELVVRVRDTGIGITPEMLPHVFDLFAQAERSLDRSQGGLGIGLTLVRILVELHGGTVSATSEGPGRGSEFTVRLPLPVDQLGANAGTSQDGDSQVSRPLQILVVDDNATAAESLALLLEMMGHETRLSYDGPEALEAAREYRPDAVLLDIGLPTMDGYEVARRLRECAEHRETLLVAVTGYGRERDRRLSREAGFDHHLVKPVDLATLERILSADVPEVAARRA